MTSQTEDVTSEQFRTPALARSSGRLQPPSQVDIVDVAQRIQILLIR